MRIDPETAEAELGTLLSPAAVAEGLAAEPEPVAELVAEPVAEPVADPVAPAVVEAPPAPPPETILPVAPGFWPGVPVGAKVPGLPAASVMVKRVVQAGGPLSL